MKTVNSKRLARPSIIRTSQFNKSTILAVGLLASVLGIFVLLRIFAAIPLTRDKYLQPFSRYSIWNMPIGSGAQYVDAGFGANDFSQWGITKENQHLAFVPNAPVTQITANNDAFNQPGYTSSNPNFRCDGNTTHYSNYTDGQGKLPADWYVGSGTNVGTLPNDMAAYLSPTSNNAVRESAVFAHCAGKGFTSLNSLTSDLALNGDGLYGAQGASGVSALGGTIRLGELRPGQTGPRHAIKLNLSGYHDAIRCSIDSGQENPNPADGNYCYRWPAHRADGYAVSQYGVGSSKTNIKMGSLLAIGKSTNCANLGLTSEPAKQLCWTLQNYGAYYIEDAYGTSGYRPPLTIAVERGYSGSLMTQAYSGDFDQQFQNDYGYSMVQGQGSTWYSDLMKLADNLQVIANNGPSSIGGGGNPLQCYAPAFSDGMADGIATNPNGNVTEPAGCPGSSATVTPAPTATAAPVAQINQTGNLVKGKTFTSNLASVGAPYTLAALNDGVEDSTSRLITTPADPLNLDVDLGAMYSLSKVAILWAGDTTKDYQLQVSQDNATWTTIAAGQTGNIPTQLINTTSFSASANGRYLRIVGASRWNSTYGHSIWEIGAYGSLVVASPTPAPSATPVPTPSPTATPVATPTPAPNITPSPTPTPASTCTKLGDVNCDGKVNSGDLNIILAHYGKRVSSRSQGDLTGDEVVNIFDLSQVLQNWGR